MKSIVVFLLLAAFNSASAQGTSAPPYTFTIEGTSPNVVLRIRKEPSPCQPLPPVVPIERVADGVLVDLTVGDACGPTTPFSEQVYNLGAFLPGTYLIRFQTCGFGPQGTICTVFATLAFDVVAHRVPSFSAGGLIVIFASFLVVAFMHRRSLA
jgi:hypothetical protein